MKLFENIEGPRNYHDRHGHVLPKENSRLQNRLDDITEYAKIHDLKLNGKKTKIMAFNFTRKYDFHPTLDLAENQLDVIYTTKLLGVFLTADCKWHENTSYIVSKAKKKIWYLRRLKALGASIETLLEMYQKSARSVLEFGAPLWTEGLTQKNKKDIERVQKTCFKVILGQHYSSYENALETLEQETLEQRRKKISKKFAKNCSRNPKFSQFFRKVRNRSYKPFIEPNTKTKRAFMGSIPYLIRLLNEDYK